MSKYLAFDLGASSGRGIIGTLDGVKLKLQEVHRFANGPLQQGNHFFWNFPSLVENLKIGLQRAFAVEKELQGVAIDTWGVDYVLFDRRTHEVKGLPYCYRDERTRAAVEKVKAEVSLEELHAITGIQPMSFNTIFQLVAHQMEHPEELENSVFLPIPDALAFMLGGDFTAEYTHCSTSGLLDPFRREWAWELIDRIGLPRQIFPEVVPSCTLGGRLSAELCKELQIPATPIWKIGSHDTASAVAAVPAPNGKKFAYLSAGTWALLGAENPAPCVTPEAGKKGFTNEGGLERSIRFLTNIMGSWLFQECRRVWNESGKNFSFADMENLARAAAPCRYLINPNDASFFEPGDMPGRIVDFCRRTEQGTPANEAEICRAIYDSLALYFRSKVALLSELSQTKYTAFNIVGGGTKDALLMQLTADALDLPVIAGPVEATAVGNILGQSIARGETAGLVGAREIVGASFELKNYAPEAEMTRLYRATTDRFSVIAPC